jgi:uncharacterized membrane protein
MVDQDSTLIAIGMMAIIIYVTRLCGYFVGLQLRHIRGIQPVLEALPGCAFMAILLPSLRNANFDELIAMACLVSIMWITNNVMVSTIIGVAVLLIL